jgi:ABC-type nitrate/sulfonate/bicarbonate transport system substrate-binding protein
MNRSIFTFAFALSLLVGCDATSPAVTPTSTPPDAAAATPVVLQLNWVHTIEFAGYYLADRNGYYRDAGIALEMREATFDDDGNLTNHIEEVASGRADFGMTGSDVLLRARAAGTRVVALATIYQRLPNILITMPDSGIIRP